MCLSSSLPQLSCSMALFFFASTPTLETRHKCHVSDVRWLPLTPSLHIEQKNTPIWGVFFLLNGSPSMSNTQNTPIWVCFKCSTAPLPPNTRNATQTSHFGCLLAPLSCFPSTCTPRHEKCNILSHFLCWPASLTSIPHLPSTKNPSLFHLLYLFYVVYVISFNLKINNFSVIPVDSSHFLILVPFQWNSCNFCKFQSYFTGIHWNDWIPAGICGASKSTAFLLHSCYFTNHF